MVITTTKLRATIYRILDQVLETGVPVEIERRGRRLRIVAVEPPDKLARLVPRADVLTCDPEDLVSVDWSVEWRP
jgi:hypothetical protein